MPDEKPLGKRILGLFVETAPDGPEPVDDGGSPADELAKLARQTAEIAKDSAPAPKVATGPLTPARAPSSAAGPVEPAKIDFDAVFKNAGVDPQAIDRVRKAEELLKNLPGGATDEMKLQIVQASLSAFGFDIGKIIEAIETQLKALETYVRVNEQQTARAVTEAQAQAQIAKLDDQIITLKADVEKRTSALASVAAAAEVRRRQVERVAEFFNASPAPHKPPASKKDD